MEERKDIEIIAEVGVNHNGDLRTALDLIGAAALAKANTVKFQLFEARKVYPPERWDEMESLQLDRNSLAHCAAECRARGVRFLCTPDTWDDARYLALAGVERIKIGSSNVTNVEMLKQVAGLGLPVILSVGACTFEEMRRAVMCFHNVVPLTVMYCVSGYPTPFEQLNLGWIARLCQWHDSVGFSDHTLGSKAAMMALAMGATVFEKHITQHPWQKGPDHRMSLDPLGFEAYVSDLREAQVALGDGDNKRIMPCEERNRVEYERFVRAQYADDPSAR